METPEPEPCGLSDIEFRELLVFCVVKLVPAVVLAAALWLAAAGVFRELVQMLLGSLLGDVVKV